MKVGAASAIKLAWLVVDFDGTCTVRDTTPTIACLAAAHNNGGVEQLSTRSTAIWCEKFDMPLLFCQLAVPSPPLSARLSCQDLESTFRMADIEEQEQSVQDFL